MWHFVQIHSSNYSVKPFPRFLKECGEFCFITFHTLGVRKETNLPLQVLEMFVGLVTLVLVR